MINLFRVKELRIVVGNLGISERGELKILRKSSNQSSGNVCWVRKELLHLYCFLQGTYVIIQSFLIWNLTECYSVLLFISLLRALPIMVRMADVCLDKGRIEAAYILYQRFSA
jgi:hypothetical protein